MLTTSSIVNEEEVLEASINANIDSVDILPNTSGDSSNHLVVWTEPSLLSQMSEVMNQLKYENVTASLEYVPVDKVKLSEEDYELSMQLIEQFEAIDDVDCIYHNIADPLA